MQITCDREQLQKYILAADRVTSKHASLPVLSSVLITTNTKEVIIRATNLEVGVEFHIPASIKSEGVVALPGALVANILSTIPDEKTISLEVKQGLCVIKTTSKTLSVKSLPVDDFPTIPIITEGDSFVIPGKKILQGVKSVISSASISDIKPEIASVYMYQQGDTLVFVATDSFRLSEKKIKHEKVSIPHGVIIPIKNITEILRIIDLEEGDLIVSTTKTQISFAGKSLYVTSRVVQGIYPDYEQIIPKTHTTEAVVLKEDLTNTLKLSTLFSDKFNKISLIIDPLKKIFLITTKNADVGEVESNLTTTLHGDPIELSLNGKHIYDCLSIIEKDSVSIQCTKPDKPVVLKGLGDQSFTYLTMPLTR